MPSLCASCNGLASISVAHSPAHPTIVNASRYLTWHASAQSAFISHRTVPHRIEFNIHSLKLFISFLVSMLLAIWSSVQKCSTAIFATDEWIEVATGKRRAKKTSQWKCDGTKKRAGKKRSRLSTTYSSRSFLYLISCTQWIVWSIQTANKKEKRRHHRQWHRLFYSEATSTKWPHCWSVDNLLILTYGCNDVDFYRMINTMTIGTQSILPFLHRRRPN